jgi:ATP-dependent Lhr-like helicase
VVNAPTGSGKTHSLIVPILLEFLRNNPEEPGKKRNGLQATWTTPIRALRREIQGTASKAATALGLDWDVAVRSGDTPTSERAKKQKMPPELLITTPESLRERLTLEKLADRVKRMRVALVKLNKNKGQDALFHY